MQFGHILAICQMSLKSLFTYRKQHRQVHKGQSTTMESALMCGTRTISVEVFISACFEQDIEFGTQGSNSLKQPKDSFIQFVQKNSLLIPVQLGHNTGSCQISWKAFSILWAKHSHFVHKYKRSIVSASLRRANLASQLINPLKEQHTSSLILHQASDTAGEEAPDRRSSVPRELLYRTGVGLQFAGEIPFPGMLLFLSENMFISTWYDQILPKFGCKNVFFVSPAERSCFDQGGDVFSCVFQCFTGLCWTIQNMNLTRLVWLGEIFSFLILSGGLLVCDALHPNRAFVFLISLWF